MKNSIRLASFGTTAALAAIVTLTAGCGGQKERARADSLQVVTAEQLKLTSQLSAQKDSLSKVIFDADDFIIKIDSQIRTVKGLPKTKRSGPSSESPIQEQLQRRKETLARVSALVARAKATAAELAASRKRELALKGENAKLQAQVDDDAKRMAEFTETIERQQARIATLEGRIDNLANQWRTLASANYKAYYIVGTERELLAKGVVEREGGANLLIAHPGRTLQPARDLNADLFTPIDQREVREIPLPDSTRRYRVVSRQSLDNAKVSERDRATFKGPLRIADAEHFWAPSRYLILVQR